jgi:D-alanine-D-alanine ligase-like ATP-grasp enzyme
MTQDIDIEALLEEIRRYLAAVDAFRAVGCEPTWRVDP